MGVSSVNTELQKQLWITKLYSDMREKLFFVQNGMMGQGENNVIEVRDEFSKDSGDTATTGILKDLVADGVVGDDEQLGHEEALISYDADIKIDQLRHAIIEKGRMDTQKGIIKIMAKAKPLLERWYANKLEHQFIQKMCGVTNATLTDVNKVVVSARCLWSNTPNIVPGADTTAGYGARYVGAAAAGSLAVTDLMTSTILDTAKVKAVTANPSIRPLMIKGIPYYVAFLHPYQLKDLRNDPIWFEAHASAGLRGNENKIFAGAAGIWNGIIIYEHPYMPFLDVSQVGYSFTGVSTGTNFNADAFRAVLVGQQAVLYEKKSMGWGSEDRDYGNQKGLGIYLMGGVQKVTFNSIDYSVITIDTSASTIVPA